MDERLSHALALYPINVLFTRHYLTANGQGYESGTAMTERAGYRV